MSLKRKAELDDGDRHFKFLIFLNVLSWKKRVHHKYVLVDLISIDAPNEDDLFSDFISQYEKHNSDVMDDEWFSRVESEIKSYIEQAWITSCNSGASRCLRLSSTNFGTMYKSAEEGTCVYETIIKCITHVPKGQSCFIMDLSPRRDYNFTYTVNWSTSEEQAIMLMLSIARSSHVDDLSEDVSEKEGAFLDLLFSRKESEYTRAICKKDHLNIADQTGCIKYTISIRDDNYFMCVFDN